MANKVEIKDTNYVYENLNRAIVVTDESGNEYRIKIHPKEGIIINKAEGEITIHPKVTNEIYVI